tara:strand:- start:279 stop:758 length:480 start_codon:yes stop_codon:yes gene_type:complete
MKMKLKTKIIILIFLLATIALSIIKFKNTSKTYVYLLNFKSEKIILGDFITLSFLSGLATSLTFLYISNQKKENQFIDNEILETKPEFSKDNLMENYSEREEDINVRPPERDIRDSQPTISVNYRVIKQNDAEVNEINGEYKKNKSQNYDDWEEIESNW